MHMIDMRSETTTAFGISYQTGAVTDAGDATGFSVEIQESDTTAAADFAAVADADLIGTESDLAVTADGTDNVAVGSLGYVGTKRYVRVVVTGSTGTDATVNGVWALQKPRYSPKGDAADNIAAT